MSQEPTFFNILPTPLNKLRPQIHLIDAISRVLVFHGFIKSSQNGNMQFNSPGWGIVEILSVAELGHCTLSGHCWLGLGIYEKISLAESQH